MFYNDLIIVVSTLGEEEFVVVAADPNGHIGEHANGYEGVHGIFGYGTFNTKGERMLEFGDAMRMTVVNTTFRKRDSRWST